MNKPSKKFKQLVAATALTATTLGGCSGMHGGINLATGEYYYHNHGKPPINITIAPRNN